MSGERRDPGDPVQALLARVRRGLGRASDERVPPPPPPVVPDERLRRVATDASTRTLRERFAREAEAAGMVVHVADEDAVSSADLLAVLDLPASGDAPDPPRIAVDVSDPALARLTDELVRRTGCERVSWTRETGLDPCFDATVGITDVDLAIAETGTLILASAGSRGRGAFLVPTRHVALVRESQIVPDLIDACDALAEGGVEELGPATILVSGPSKTADIEGVLVVGVHGPGRVDVLILPSQVGVDRGPGESPLAG